MSYVSRTPLSKVKGQLAGGGGIFWRPPAQIVRIINKEVSFLVFSRQRCWNDLKVTFQVVGNSKVTVYTYIIRLPS